MAQQTISGALITHALGGFPKKPKVPDLPRVNLAEQQQKAVADNTAVLPGAEKLASQVNTFQSGELQRLANAAFPFFDQLLAKSSQNASDLLSGKLSPDVSRAVEASSAARALGGGYGGTGMGRALTLRDLGLTSFQGQQQGLANFGQLAQITQPLVPRPFDVTSMFVAPLQRATWENEQNIQQFQHDWMVNQVAAQPDPFKAALGEAFNNFMATWAAFGMSALGNLGGGGLTSGAPSNHEVATDPMYLNFG